MDFIWEGPDYAQETFNQFLRVTNERVQESEVIVPKIVAGGLLQGKSIWFIPITWFNRGAIMLSPHVSAYPQFRLTHVILHNQLIFNQFYHQFVDISLIN